MRITAEQHLTKDLDKWVGKATSFTYIVNNKYEVTMITPINWKMKDFPKMIAESYKSLPIVDIYSVHIKDVREDVSSKN